ncbi:MAG: hypothetical protein RLY31_921 [Bacteroidota bacterium]
MGTWQLGGPTVWGGKQTGWGSTDYAEATDALVHAMENGINFFDTSDAYGRGKSEELLGQALRMTGDKDMVVCTKFGTREDAAGQVYTDFSEAWLLRSVEGSLRRLGRDRLDVLLLHSPPDDFDWSRYDSSPLDKLVAAGKIRAYGVSAKTLAGARNAILSGFGTVVEAIYNMIDRRAEAAVFPLCREQGYAFIARCPLASGFLTDRPPQALPSDDIRHSIPPAQHEWMQEHTARLRTVLQAEEPFTFAENALRFAASHPDVSVVIPGMRRRQQVESVLRVRDHLPLSPVRCEAIARAVPETYPGWIR